MSALRIGMVAHKTGGGYQGMWTVVSVFRKLDGTERVVAESQEIPGLLHIFAPSQLEPIVPDPCG